MLTNLAAASVFPSTYGWAVLRGYGHVPSPHLRSNPSFPLRGLVFCSKCGHKLTASFATGGHGKKYGQYRCKNSK